jgi:hypothetical protein
MSFTFQEESVMVQRQGWLAGVFAVVLAALLTSTAFAEKTKIKISKEWKGSVADEKLLKDAPACVTDAKGLEKLWKAWKIEDKMPEVDFTKEIVVITTTSGSKISIFANLDDKGNLEVGGLATRDFGEGFRYVIATVPREGVKTVNGKDLPAEKKDKDK